MNLLPAQIQMDAVMLRVADLDLMTKYCSEVMGLRVLSEDVSSRVLGGYRG
jgi:catechol-2,3-dioxygenase